MEYTFMSLGSDCSTDYNLRRLGLKVSTGPFAWSKSSIKSIMTALIERFDYDRFINSITLLKKSYNHPSIDSMFNDDFAASATEEINSTRSYLLKNYYGFTFAHEVLRTYQLSEFKERVKARVDRFYSLKDTPMNFIRFESKNIKDKPLYYKKLQLVADILSNDFNDFTITVLIPFQYIDKEGNNYINYTCNNGSTVRIQFFSYDNTKFTDWKQVHVYDEWYKSIM